MAEEKLELVVVAEQLPEKSIKVMWDLAAIVFAENPVLCEGVEMVNLTWPGNCEAVLVQSRGELQEEACQQCKDGYGPFADCVVVAGCFGGACAGCHVNSMMKQCLFRADYAPRTRGNKRKWTPAVEEGNEGEEEEEEDPKKWAAMRVYNCMTSAMMAAVSLVSAQQAFSQVLVLACQQFTVAAKASSALAAVMVAFTDLYAEEVGLEGVEPIGEGVGAADPDDEGEGVAGGAGGAIGDLVRQRGRGAGGVAAGGLPNLDDLVGRIAGNVEWWLLGELQGDGVEE
ncbi:hypothetical protein PRK78_006564 [Emydomyces testavorans]|uniref:Uncharacterized protein n=1 Tax=Emydomyces testavorans TaxID=2070801 RepID=A0AAF0IKM2_9EURO|nr:hypothetical protein PRK78_006564 [Emydomyces testavorans]